MAQLLEPIKKDLHRVMAEKLTAADITFQESVGKLVSSQATVDRMGQAAGTAMQSVMLAAHRDSLQNQLIPSFDSATRHMYQQMDKAFNDGLTDCK